MELALILILVGLVLAGPVTAVAIGLRRRQPELEAPPEAPPALPPEALPEAEAPEADVAEVDVEVEAPPVEAPPAPVRPRLRDRLGKARTLLAGYVGSILSRSSIDDETWYEL